MRRHRVRELDRAHDRLDRKLGLYTSLTIARTAWARQLPRRERRHPRRGALLEPRLLERDRANVDSSGIEGEYSAITVGTDGRGVISYYDGSGLSQDLKVAHCGNVACTTASYLAVDTAGQVGWSTSITVGSDGLPFVSSAT